MARHTEQALKWLAQVQESPLDPRQPIIDPHHHLWTHPTNRYLLDELWSDTGAGHHVVKTVFVECMSGYLQDGPEALRPVGETHFVRALCEDSERREGACIAGIVGFADLSLGSAVREVLVAHIDAGQGRFKGIRHAVGWDASESIRNSHTRPPAHLLLDEQFRRGFAELAPLGLSFDAWLYHPQLPELVDLARAFPDTTIVLDHFGGPLGIGPYQGRRESIFERWQRDITELAACPNVVAKLGGLAMPVNGFDWHRAEKPPGSAELAECQAPWHRFMIERFGAERCMFESNFPVDRASCSYVVLWNAFKRIASEYSAEQRQALFHDTAARVYRLAEPA
ncbi:MAG: amidohydrolase family protein [Gammaproteobacteria bacterium]|nr:amidohydrolase family protein [Gammaproteobacteria bacterium]